MSELTSQQKCSGFSWVVEAQSAWYSTVVIGSTALIGCLHRLKDGVHLSLGGSRYLLLLYHAVAITLIVSRLRIPITITAAHVLSKVKG